MPIHKEGYRILTSFLVLFIVINVIVYFAADGNIWIVLPVMVVSIVFYSLVLWFFRNPLRKRIDNQLEIIAPADGKVVVIEKTQENEYFNDERIQISVFMSPLNVHSNKYPVSGKVKYYKYHPGKYLVAWHPKSSTENERTTVVLETENGEEILVRQIAGAVARRIVCYAKENTNVKQGDELGFIKFGSRVDVFLPLKADVKVHLDDMVKANYTTLAKFLPKQ